MKRSALWRGLSVLLVLGLASRAAAHKPSDSYLTLELADDSVRGRWDLSLRDLDRALALDADGDGALTGAELRAREAELVRYALAQLTLTRGNGPCAVHAQALSTVAHSDGRYLRLPFQGACTGGALRLRYDFFFALDPQHRAVVRHGSDTFVLSQGARTQVLNGESGLRALLVHGVEHIWTGLDHVLFLLALLLPSVLRSAALRPLLGEVVRVVSAFTLAHSLTLALAVLGVVRMDANWIEPAIAASVALAALANLRPALGESRASLAFALGLLHGFGFSSALSDLGLAGGALWRALLAFNAGVELGQLALIGVFVPLAYALRRARLYEWVLVRGGSLAIAGCALVWFAERVVGG